MKLVIISGRSGSGKSISLHCLEDLGYYVVDNLPWVLLPDLLNNLSQSHTHVAISLDSRNIPSDPQILDHIFEQVLSTYQDVEALYLDADDHTLLKRYSETRRKHPLSSVNVSLQEAIAKERVLLEPVANRADLLIDTRDMTAHQLSCLMRDRVAPREQASLSILFQSFGFKHGVPNDVDYLFDIRCLPNPYWEPTLRGFTGLDQPIIEFLQAHPSVEQMQHSIEAFLEQWIPAFKADRRSYLTIGIGCTGGQHRSVYMAERLAEHFRSLYKCIQVRHREVSSSSGS
jgi:UPF0042 nucleotide-binding protein